MAVNVPSRTSVINQLAQSYAEKTAWRLKLLDAYLFYAMLSGILQFIYCLLVGTFPYNSFLSGFITSVGTFVFAANLRLQLGSDYMPHLDKIRGFGDFILCHLVLLFFSVHFMG